jgi:hypothetical protein
MERKAMLEMSEAITTDTDALEGDEDIILSFDDITGLTGIKPLIIYEAHGKVKTGVLEKVKPNTTFLVRGQGVRKGELGYNAKSSVNTTSLVPVIALLDVQLIESMGIDPSLLGLGAKCIQEYLHPAPRINPLVDTLVEQYEESEGILREFFPVVEDVDEVDDMSGHARWDISEGLEEQFSPVVEDVDAVVSTERVSEHAFNGDSIGELGHILGSLQYGDG